MECVSLLALWALQGDTTQPNPSFGSLNGVGSSVQPCAWVIERNLSDRSAHARKPQRRQERGEASSKWVFPISRVFCVLWFDGLGKLWLVASAGGRNRPASAKIPFCARQCARSDRVLSSHVGFAVVSGLSRVRPARSLRKAVQPVRTAPDVTSLLQQAEPRQVPLSKAHLIVLRSADSRRRLQGISGPARSRRRKPADLADPRNQSADSRRRLPAVAQSRATVGSPVAAAVGRRKWAD